MNHTIPTPPHHHPQKKNNVVDQFYEAMMA